MIDHTEENLDMNENNPGKNDAEDSVQLDLSAVRGTKAYDESRKAADNLARNPDQLGKFLVHLEEKLQNIPKIGSILASVPVMVSMVRSYYKKEYTLLPIGTLVGILAALVYFVSPVDIIPDTIPGIGYLDDALVVAVTMSFIKADVDTYKEWRDKQNLS